MLTPGTILNRNEGNPGNSNQKAQNIATVTCGATVLNIFPNDNTEQVYQRQQSHVLMDCS